MGNLQYLTIQEYIDALNKVNYNAPPTSIIAVERRIEKVLNCIEILPFSPQFDFLVRNTTYIGEFNTKEIVTILDQLNIVNIPCDFCKGRLSFAQKVCYDTSTDKLKVNQVCIFCKIALMEWPPTIGVIYPSEKYIPPKRKRNQEIVLLGWEGGDSPDYVNISKKDIKNFYPILRASSDEEMRKLTSK